jgi:uncharacterized Zn finger protein (UPF0148 family)
MIFNKDEKDRKINNLYKNQEIYCPECGAKLIPAEGCLYCPFCGWSKCK